LTPENEYNNALGVLQEFDLMLGEMAGMQHRFIWTSG
jgi:hypothetical protein